ncbi:hypothetical protein Dimus_006832 [Dionaea muscipula]
MFFSSAHSAAVQLPSLPLHTLMPSLPVKSFTCLHFQAPSSSICAAPHNGKATTVAPISLRIRAVSLNDEIPPNALCQKQDPLWAGGFSLGVDLGLSRTGVAISKGFTFRPLAVLELRGQKLEHRLIEIAAREEADEFIIGLPKSSDGKETPQSNKVRSTAGRLAVLAAYRGWRVYLQDEYGTSAEAMDRMISMGLSWSARQGKVDAYAAVMVLERYFSMSGRTTELVLPKKLELQEKLLKGGPRKDDDFF